ncbi:hypothetical protein Nmel_015540 [Mimus melanotis]
MLMQRLVQCFLSLGALSRQDGVIDLFLGVSLTSQLPQGPPAALIEELQAGSIQDLGN